MKVLVLGAGNVGMIVAKMLDTVLPEINLTVADIGPEWNFKWERRSVPPKYKQTDFLTFTGPHNLRLLIIEADIVVSCLPVSVMKAVVPAKQCAELGKHYLDITEDVGLTDIHRTFDARAKETGAFIIPQCGLAPGLINIIAGDVYRGFDTCTDLKLSVGALPTVPANSLGYAFTWSVEGLINEYINPCYAIVNGQSQMILPLEGLETIIIDGVTLEAFNTSGGLGSLAESLSPINMSYKTMRYPGHCALMKFLLNDLKLRENPDLAKEILTNAIPNTEKDLVFMRVVGTGQRNGRLVQDTWTAIAKARPDMTALQLTTGFGVAAIVELIVNGELEKAHGRRGGLVLLENVVTEKMLAATQMNKKFAVI